MWASNVGGAYDIYHVEAVDFSYSMYDPWWDWHQLTQDTLLDRSPVLSPVLQDTVFYAWESYRDGNWDIMGAAMYISIGDVEGASSSMPSAYQLWQNYPNPFNSQTTIRYQIAKSTFVTIEIIDLLGRKVRTLVSEKHAFGTYKVNWDGKSDLGQLLPSGVYLCRLQARNFVDVKRMVLLR